MIFLPEKNSDSVFNKGIRCVFISIFATVFCIGFTSLLKVYAGLCTPCKTWCSHVNVTTCATDDICSHVKAQCSNNNCDDASPWTCTSYRCQDRCDGGV
jgi:hypothetical protein